MAKFQDIKADIFMDTLLESHHDTPMIEYIQRAAEVCAVGAMFALPLSTTWTDILLVLAVLFTLLSPHKARFFHTIKTNPTSWLFVSFFGLYLLGCLWSVAPLHDISKSLLKNAKLLYGAFLLPVFVSGRTRSLALNALIFAITLVMALSYAKAFGWIMLSERYHDAAVFKSHIQTNFLMAFYAYIVGYRALQKSSWHGLWITLFALACVKTFFFSEGRSGYIVFAALMMLLGWQQFRWKGMLVGILTTGLLVSSAMMISPHFQHRFDQAVQETQRYHSGDMAPTSTGLRLSFYRDALKIIQLRPILGSGTGSVVTRYQQVNPNPQFQTHNPHNEYLNVGIQLGMVGVAFLLFFFARLWSGSNKIPAPWQHFAKATVIAIALGCTLNSWLLDTLQGHFFAMMLALCFATLNDQKAKN